MIDLYEYLDYRDFLRHHYDINRKLHRYFTFRYVTGKTGLDASFYVKVINKQLHLSDKSVPIMSVFLKLGKEQAEYFALLVKFNKSKSNEDSKLYFEKLIKLKGHSSKVLHPDQYEFFRKWYYAAVKELISFHPFRGDYEELASRLNPPITAVQARKAIELLEGLGLIRKNDQDTYVLAEKNLTTGDEWVKVAPIAIRNFQKELMQRALEAVDGIAPEERDISTLSFSVSKERIGAMRERITEMRAELIRLANEDAGPDSVYQLNIQLFPVTRPAPGTPR